MDEVGEAEGGGDEEETHAKKIRPQSDKKDQ
jgi:hypothetical protein